MGNGASGHSSAVSLTGEEKAHRQEVQRYPPFFAGKRKWYVIHTYSGHENKVKINLEKRVEYMEMGDKIFRAFVPMEKQYETKNGRRNTVMQTLFPGYVLVEMIIDDISWFVVRNTPGVTGFVGPASKPVPLTEEEIDRIFKRVGLDDARPSVQFGVEEKVRITSGPFADFVGTVQEVDPVKAKLKVTISMFGRESPLELNFDRVEKI